MTSTDSSAPKRLKFNAPAPVEKDNKKELDSAPSVVAAPQHGLQHMSADCLGLTGPGTRLQVRPKTFLNLFQGAPIVIPIFQRAYCWPEQQLRRWWRDATRSNPSAANRHHTGKAFFTVRDGNLLCIDGQQRCTTQQLLLAAVRDCALQELTNSDPSVVNEAESFIGTLEDLLFPDKVAMRSWAQEWAAQAEAAVRQAADDQTLAGQWERALEIGAQLPFKGGARLLPSFVDRRPFFELLLIGRCSYELRRAFATRPCTGHVHAGPNPELPLSSHAQGSQQALAKGVFAEEALALVQRIGEGDQHDDGGGKARVNALRGAVESALGGMQLMYCEVQSDVNLSQVFLWLQEKSLFGVGQILYNAAPGVDFRPADLTRNLLLSSAVMRRCDMSEQEQVFRREWVDPVERSAGSPERMDAMVRAFVASLDEGEDGRSEVEGAREESTMGEAEAAAVELDGGVGSRAERRRARGRRARVKGSLEARLEGMIAGMIPNEQRVFRRLTRRGAPMQVYARIHAHAEELQRRRDAEAKEAAGAEKGEGGARNSDVGSDSEVAISEQALAELLQQLRGFADRFWPRGESGLE